MELVGPDNGNHSPAITSPMEIMQLRSSMQDQALRVRAKKGDPIRSVYIPRGSSLRPKELREALYSVIIKSDGNAALDKETYKKLLVSGLYWLHNGESYFVPITIIAKNIDYFCTAKDGIMYLTNPGIQQAKRRSNLVLYVPCILILLFLCVHYASGSLEEAFYATVQVIFVPFLLYITSWLLYNMSNSFRVCCDHSYHYLASNVYVDIFLCSLPGRILLTLLGLGCLSALRIGNGLWFKLILKSDEDLSDVIRYVFRHGWWGFSSSFDPKKPSPELFNVCFKIFKSTTSFWEERPEICR